VIPASSLSSWTKPLTKTNSKETIESEQIDITEISKEYEKFKTVKR